MNHIEKFIQSLGQINGEETIDRKVLLENISLYTAEEAEKDSDLSLLGEIEENITQTLNPKLGIDPIDFSCMLNQLIVEYHSK